jgi:hypothetical protein
VSIGPDGGTRRARSRSARIVLHRRLHAALHHFEGERLVAHALQEPRRETAGGKLRRRDHLTQVIEVGLDAGTGDFGQCRLQRRDRPHAVVRLDDDLGEHGIVEGADLGAGVDPAVAAHVLGEADRGERAGARPEVVRRILGIEPDLNRRAARRHAQRLERRHLARAQLHHPLDEIDAGDFLRHAMLDLQARVDLEEIELLAVSVEEELDGTRRPVLQRAGDPD